MLDIKFIRENPDKIKDACQKKQVDCDIDRLLEVDKKRRELMQETENLKAEQNKISSQKDGDREKAKDLKKKIKELDPELKKVNEEYDKLMRLIPNPPLNDVIKGKDEKENKVLRQEGEKTKFSSKGGQGFKPKDYLEIAEKLDIIDVKRAAKVSGARFGYFKGGAALLELALIQLAFQNLTKKGFIPIIPPVMLNDRSMRGMGYLDRGVDEVYHLEKDNLYLAGTSEQSIGAMHIDEVFQEEDLPKRYVGFSSCFRREAGAYGKDTRGILRVHQFDKVEMFSFCKPEESQKEHKFLLSMQEKLMKLLKISYQVVQIGVDDLGFPAAAAYDIEAWMPSEGRYRETHSAFHDTDFQTRRLNIRYRSKDRTDFPHALNGTAFAIGRMIIAIIENYQQKDGSIKIPVVLQKYIKKKQIK